MRKLILVALILAVIPLGAEARKKKPATPKEPEQTEYEKFFKDKKCETVEGMFTLHKGEGNIYFEIPEEMMGREMLLGSTITEITDNRFGNVGEKPFWPLHIAFVVADSAVNMVNINSGYIAGERNIAERMATSMTPAVIKRFPIAVYSADSTSVVIDMTEFLLDDRTELSPFSPHALGLERRTMEKVFSKDNSYIAGIKAFNDNVSVQSSLGYTMSLKDKDYYYLHQVPFTAVMTRSFVLLPEQPMDPRRADPRINVFYSGKQEFTNKARSLDNIYYAHRWRLEPSDEAAYRRGDLTEPVKPIIFYLDNTFPESWKPYLRTGILEWNAAFEKIGFKDAVRVLDFPQDDPEFDPDNIKYSCVRYSPSMIPNAMGPSWVDPRTGEIVNASVYMFHNIVKLVQGWRFIQTAQADADVRSTVMPEDMLGDCLRYVVAHEIGHCLGFMHNMSSSAAIPVDSLRSPTFTQKYGTTYSIMDYARYNYVAQPGDKERGVSLSPPKLGVYDDFAVKWLYTPLREYPSKQAQQILDGWITDTSGNMMYRYGRQQFSGLLDPTSLSEDLGDDAVAASEYGIRNLKYIAANLNDWVGGEDRDFTFRQQIYTELVSQYIRYLNNVMVNIGGVYLYERYEGDRWPSYRTVPAETQRRALDFVLNELKDLEWIDVPELTRNFDLAANQSGQIQDALFQGILSLQNKVAATELKSTGDTFTTVMFLDRIADYVWEPTRKMRKLTPLERKMQNKFVSTLLMGAGTTVKGLHGSSLAFGISGGLPVDFPEWVKENNERVYGCQPEQITAHYREQGNYSTGPVQGFGNAITLNTSMVPMNYRMFSMLTEARSLISSRAGTGDRDTRDHYKLLLYKIDRSLE